MTRRIDEGDVPAALLPENDVHVDVAVAMGRGELSRGEERDVRARMLQDAAYRAVVEPIVASYEERRLSASEAEIGWPDFVRAAGLPETVAHGATGTRAEGQHRERRRLLASIGGVIAALLLVWLVGVGGFYYAKAQRYHTITTNATQTIETVLPDGTLATVGPSSSLKFPKSMLSFDGHPDRRRIVWPKGEVTLSVPKRDLMVPGGGHTLRVLQIETKHAWLTVVTSAKVRLAELPASTSVAVLEGNVLARRRSKGGSETMQLTAPSGAHFTATSMETYRVTPSP